MSVEEIAATMARDISADIYGDITGHEYWAEEVFGLREANRLLREQVDSLQIQMGKLPI